MSGDRTPPPCRHFRFQDTRCSASLSEMKAKTDLLPSLLRAMGQMGAYAVTLACGPHRTLCLGVLFHEKIA